MRFVGVIHHRQHGLLLGNSWDELLRTEDAKHLMFPTFPHLFDEEERSLVGVTEEQMDVLLDTAAEMIPEAFPSIFSFWQSRRVGAAGLH